MPGSHQPHHDEPEQTDVAAPEARGRPLLWASAPARRRLMALVVPAYVAAIGLGLAYTRVDHRADLVVPAVGIGALVGAVALVLTVGAALVTIADWRTAVAARSESLARVPLAITERQWQQMAEAVTHEADSTLSWVNVAVPALVVVLVAAVNVAATGLAIVGLAVVAFVPLVVVLAVGRVWSQRAMHRRHRRRLASVPDRDVVLAPRALYDPLRGAVRIRRRDQVHYVPPGGYRAWRDDLAERVPGSVWDSPYPSSTLTKRPLIVVRLRRGAGPFGGRIDIVHPVAFGKDEAELAQEVAAHQTPRAPATGEARRR